MIYSMIKWYGLSGVIQIKVVIVIVHLKLHLRYLGVFQSEYKILDELFQYFQYTLVDDPYSDKKKTSHHDMKYTEFSFKIPYFCL